MRNELRQYQVIPLQFVIYDEDDELVNINTATAMWVNHIKPDSTTGQWVGGFTGQGGIDGIVQYITLITDLDQLGDWQFQAYAVVGGVTYPSDMVNERIYPNITVTP